MKPYLLNKGFYYVFLLLFTIMGVQTQSYADGCNTSGFTLRHCQNSAITDQFLYCFAPGSSSDEPNNTTYYWDFGDGQTLIKHNDPSESCHTYSAPGTYTLTLIVDPLSWNKTCTMTQTFTIPNITYAIAVLETCTQTTLSVSVNATNWYLDGVGPKNTGNETITAPGTYNIQVKTGNCIYKDTNVNFFPIQYNATNLSNFNGVNISCHGQSDGSITANITGGQPDYVYELQGGPTVTTPNTSHTFDNLPAGTYSVTITDSRNCPVTQTYTLTEPPELTSTFQANPAICLPAPAEGSIDITDISGGTAPYTVLWSSGNTTLQEANIPVGQHSFTYTVTDANGCTIDRAPEILNTAKPEPEFTWTDVCLYDPMPFTDQSTIIDGTINAWNWNFGDGTTDNSQNPNHYFLTDGTHTVTLIVTSNYGCNNTIQHDITSYPVPLAQVDVDNECYYTEFTFNDITLLNAPDNLTAWIYDFGDGSAFVQSQNATHTYNSPGDYNVTMIATTNHGCVDDTTFTVTAYQKPVANFSNSTVCENTPPTLFTNQSTVVLGSENSTIIGWSWSFDDVINNTSGLPNPPHYYTHAGIYDVTLIVQTNYGCLDTIVHPVTVLAKPTNDFTSDITEDCSPACINFQDLTVSNATNITNWYWTLNDGVSSLLQNPSNCYYNSSHINDSTFDVTLITTNDLGCSDTLTKSDYITSWHNPVAEFSVEYDTMDMYMENFTFYNEAIGADYYHWDMGDGTLYDDFEVNHHIYPDTGKFYVQLAVETINGCVDTVVHPVIVKPVISLFVPNAFTPNGDGDNDEFFFKAYGIRKQGIEFMVFDRWGTLIYYTDAVRPWDGTYKGVPVQEDAYVWKLKCVDVFGNEHRKKGHVSVIR